MTILAEKRIILGVTGSIAAYKAAVVASQLTQAGAQVDVVMTEAARRFVTPLTFQALTGRAVYTSMWEAETGGGLETHIAHVGLAHQAESFLDGSVPDIVMAASGRRVSELEWDLLMLIRP